jgi:hypothetical protein
MLPIRGFLPRRGGVLVVLAASLTGATCGGEGGEGDGGVCSSPSDVGDLPCEVATVLADKCQYCHGDPLTGGAHFPLLGFEDAADVFGTQGKRRWESMAVVIEPDGAPHMPYGDSPQLTPTELTTLRDWLADCAPPEPEGAGCDVDE